MRVKCLAQEHNTISLARARTPAARSEVKRTNHEATASPTRKKMAGVHFTQYFMNQTKPTGHREIYGLMAVVPILTALLLSSLNDLQFFFVFLYVLLEFSFAMQ